ncbi:unnamed protein product [Meganyctiphanes norvegica]|uniref:Uncharacterized protein n=1 Tax=Meganyctiphanes norvegica TaxID=48144 RepID=A0AAV2RIH7_MEGNR
MGIMKLRKVVISVGIVMQLVILCTAVTTPAPVAAPTPAPKPAPTVPPAAPPVALPAAPPAEPKEECTEIVSNLIPTGKILRLCQPVGTTQAPPKSPVRIIYGFNAYYFGWMVGLAVAASLIVVASIVLICLKKYKGTNNYSPKEHEPLKEEPLLQPQA